MLVEEFDDGVSGPDELEMSFVGVGDKNQRISLLKCTQEIFGNQQSGQENRRPYIAKSDQIHLERRSFTEIRVKFAGRDFAAFVSADPGFVPENFFKSIARDRARSVQCLHAGLEVEVDQDLTQIEQKCLN